MSTISSMLPAILEARPYWRRQLAAAGLIEIIDGRPSCSDAALHAIGQLLDREHAVRRRIRDRVRSIAAMPKHERAAALDELERAAVVRDLEAVRAARTAAAASPNQGSPTIADAPKGRQGPPGGRGPATMSPSRSGARRPSPGGKVGRSAPARQGIKGPLRPDPAAS